MTLFSLQIQAGTIEVGQWIPWSSLKQEALKWPLSFQTQGQDITLQWQEWKPQALHTDFSVTGQIQNLQITKEGIQAQASNLSATLKVGGLSLDQTVVQTIGGNQITIRIKASCQPFQVVIPSFDLNVQAPYQKALNAWQPVLSQLQLVIHDGWSLSQLSCEGPMGLEDRLTTMIQDSLKNPAALASLLQNYLSPRLQAQWQDSWLKLTSETYQSLQIKSMGEPLEEGFFLKGEISAGNGDFRIALPSDMTVLSKATTPQLVISSEGFATLAREQLGKVSIQNYDLQQVPAFAKLMKSRFMQFFVWSDLLHFGRSTPFWLSTKPDSKVDLKDLGGGKWQVQIQTLGMIEVNRKGKRWTYINWGVGLSANATTEVKDSRLLLQSGTPKSNLNWSFDPEYVKAFDPSGISSKVLKAATEALFTSRSTEVALPTLQTKDKIWKLNGWTEDRGLVWMEWH